MTNREERQIELNARVAELRASAERKQAEADRLRSAVTEDFAFWSQPAYSNAAGRAFSNQRARERGKMIKASEIAAIAKELREKADRIEARGVVMAGDAAAEREAIIAAADFSVGQTVKTVFYGIGTVLKVNAKSIKVACGNGNITVPKQFAEAR